MPVESPMLVESRDHVFSLYLHSYRLASVSITQNTLVFCWFFWPSINRVRGLEILFLA